MIWRIQYRLLLLYWGWFFVHDADRKLVRINLRNQNYIRCIKSIRSPIFERFFGDVLSIILKKSLSKRFSEHEMYKLYEHSSNVIPVDTGRKLNLYKTFTRRPGRLLNVLCTYNLRLVSTGWCENGKNTLCKLLNQKWLFVYV